MTPAASMRAASLACLLAALAACGGTSNGAPGTSAEPAATAGRERPESCPATAAAPDPLPGTRPEHRQLAHWIAQQARYGDPDEVLLSPEAIADHARALRGAGDIDGEPGPADLRAPVDAASIRTQASERIAFVREAATSGQYVVDDGERLGEETVAELAMPATLEVHPAVRVALADLALRCGPTETSFYTKPVDLAFDRNDCSLVRAQEPVQVLARFPNGTWLARTSYALGWIAGDAPLSPALEGAALEGAVAGPHASLDVDTDVTPASGDAVHLAAGTRVALTADGSRALLGTRQGLVPAEIPADHLVRTRRPLTRRAVLTEAFRWLDAPYGWGGHDGGRDCSSFLLDVFATFGLPLPRHSARQAASGTFVIDTDERVTPAQKSELIDAAARRGVVLLHFPGHIMLYLGRDANGTPMVIHAFSEYVEPCAGTAAGDEPPLEILRRVDRVAVTTLSLGAGTSRRSFLERITRIVVLGKAPDLDLGGVATLRKPAPADLPVNCEDSTEVAIFRSPAQPVEGKPLRVIVTSEHDTGPSELVLVDPDGRIERPTMHRLGAPPWTVWAEVASPKAGRWTAILGDGSRTEACESFAVARHPIAAAPRAAGAPAWVPSWSWERDTENLYAAFVEQLFREPEDAETTWPSLQVVLADPARNLLHDHLGLGEDGVLALEPDCADLPYFLRAYFAWKVRLPFGYRRCNRGRAGQPPTCDPTPTTSLLPVDARDEIGAFEALRRDLGNAVHSASARMVPNDEATDTYPVALTRETLRPGTVFADPYGHLLVVARWIPQRQHEDGVLIGADAQPDATIGRRRFWRGSFLFTPETTDVGAGFKAWRPIVYDRRAQTIAVATNAELRNRRDRPSWSREQYDLDVDAFYDRVEGLANPRAREPERLLLARVDALEESVLRRVVSIDTGEQYVREHPGRTIEMPEGYAVFETAGAWEDFATPSRDMRLLISIDTVAGFPAEVAARPERFGVAPEDVAALRTRLDEKLRDELARRRFRYTRSDGTSQELTLADVVTRAPALEIAYDPNDCVEHRWGAPEGSPERTTCQRRAPADQRRRMEVYRAWFHDRQRPPR